MDADRLLGGLDESQRRAVTNPHRPLAILAPAGSGKTRVLTRRLAWQAATGLIDPRRVLCLSFTREAAGELRRRVGKLGLRELPAAGTFHATAYALLRVRWADLHQRPPELLVDRGGYLRRLFPDLKAPARASVEAELSWAKARGIDLAAYARPAHTAGRRPVGGISAMSAHLARYEQACRRAELVDFDDLLTRCADAIDGDPGFAATQRWRFRHLFVDEFQDVNPLQFRLLRCWLGDGDDVCVVGDPEQAIYGWNGADAGYLADFRDHFPGARVERLDHNHRSTPQIVAVAEAVLAPPGLGGWLGGGARAGATSQLPDGRVPVLAAHTDENAEGAALAGWCRARFQEGIGWSAQAVLVRTNQLARQLAERLNAAGVPARLLLARPRAGQLAALIAAAREAPTVAVLAADAGAGELDELSQEERALLVELLGEYLALDPAGSIARFVAWLNGPLLADRVGGGVTVATFHAAKGLEWRAVHVAGLEDGLVPSARATSEAARAEEQRLLHVALSRATEQLACSWTRQRLGSGRRQERRPSPHLEAVDLCCRRLAQRARPVTPPARQELFASAGIAAGDVDATVEEGGDADAVLAALLAWRRQWARGVSVPEVAVLGDDAVRAVARRRPRSAEELAAVPGVGPARAGRLGPSLLAALGGA